MATTLLLCQRLSKNLCSFKNKVINGMKYLKNTTNFFWHLRNTFLSRTCRTKKRRYYIFVDSLLRNVLKNGLAKTPKKTPFQPQRTSLRPRRFSWCLPGPRRGFGWNPDRYRSSALPYSYSRPAVPTPCWRRRRRWRCLCPQGAWPA